MTMQRTIIVGASHAGAQLAASLRQEKWSDEIVLIGDESALPYHRPPLSKAYLADRSTLADLAIRSPDFYAKQRIHLLNATVEKVDRAAGHVILHNGDALPYDKLALCTGARPRRLLTPGADLAGVYYLRTAADCRQDPGGRQPRLSRRDRRGWLHRSRDGGLVASAGSGGHRARSDRPRPRACHRARGVGVLRPDPSGKGVNIRTDALVEALSGVGRVREVALADGESIPADLVIVGIGIEPNTDLAAAAGLAVDNGIVIDDQARTSAPDIVAAGDCAIHNMARYGRRIRLESVPSAGEQAKVAAATICGKQRKIAALPWFWSDQYHHKLQIAGLNSGYDETVLRGDPTRDGDFTCFYLRAGELLAADCINRPRDFMFSKRAIAQKLPTDRTKLSSPIAV